MASGQTCWKDQRSEGWIPYLHRVADVAEREDIVENRSNRSLRLHGTSWKSGSLYPRANDLEGICDYVFSTIVYPIYAHPLPDILTVIEDRLDSKLFARPQPLPAGIGAATKFFPMLPLLFPRVAGPRAFYAILHHLLPDAEARTSRSLSHRLVVAHEALHHHLHLPNAFASLPQTREAYEDLSERYKAFLNGKVEEYFGPDPTVAEAEAEACALLLLLGRGYTQIRNRTSSEIHERYAPWVASENLKLFVDRVSERIANNPRPPLLADITLPSSLKHAPKRALNLSTDRLEQLDSTAASIVAMGRKHPHAWICRMLEDRFLEIRHRKNVLVRCFPETVPEPYCVIERQNLHSIFTDVNERNPHLIRYCIHYPDSWDLGDNPEDRVRFYQWFGLLDLRERKHPPTASMIGVTKYLTDYESIDRERSLNFALALDALVGARQASAPYSLGHVRGMLADSPFGFDPLLETRVSTHPQTGALIFPLIENSSVAEQEPHLVLTGYVESVDAPSHVNVIARDSRQAAPKRLRMPYQVFANAGLLGVNMRFKYEMSIQGNKLISELTPDEVDRRQYPLPDGVHPMRDLAEIKQLESAEEEGHGDG